MTKNSLTGSCHCTNIALLFDTEQRPSDLSARFCTCSYCKRLYARYTSDPNGSVALTIAEDESVIRYRFGTGNADFLTCGRCGVYVGAVADLVDGQRMVINIGVLDCADQFRTPEDHSYEGEDANARTSRWSARWTPVIVKTRPD
jgi:hypothetical protein